MNEQDANKVPKFRLDTKVLARSFRIFRFIRPYYGYFIAGMVLLVLGSIFFMALMGLPGEMTNKAIGEQKFKFLNLDVWDYGWVFMIILVVQGIFSYYRTYFFAIVSEKGMADLRIALFNKIITQPVVFFEEKRVGELTSRITADVEQLQAVFSVTLAEFIRQVVIMIIGVLILVIAMPHLSAIMLLTFPAIVIVAMVFGRYIRKLSKNRQDELAKTNTVVEEAFQSFSVVKAFVNEWYESTRYSKSVDQIVQVSLKFARVRGIFFIFVITILFGGIFFILWRGALMVQEGSMEAGDLFTFIIYTGIIGGAIASFGSLYTQISGAIGATERIMEILDSGCEVEIGQINATNFRIRGDIMYENVSFSYPTRKDIQVLKDINIKILAGQKVALVGQSGGGKSTIVQLLMHFYDPESGRICVDGKALDEYDLPGLRRNIGIVPQEVILFGGTIRENIAYGKPGASEDEIISAAKASNSWEFITSFPDGLDTVVGERGIKLSGGQRQRIAIARALLKDPRILILDEATSSLDAESERLVQDALDKLMEGRTSIIIAHRLATIKEVDCIYVLDGGRIVESGTHEELINEPDGIYSSLAKLQFDPIMES